MASFVKYQCFVGDVFGKVHDLLGTAGVGADTCKVLLSNTAPDVAANTVKADAAEIGAGHGYTAGGASASNVGSASGGTFTLVGTDIVFTAAGGSIGPFRYFILYNATASGGPLIAYWDYGSSITSLDTQTVTVDFSVNLFTAV